MLGESQFFYLFTKQKLSDMFGTISSCGSLEWSYGSWPLEFCKFLCSMVDHFLLLTSSKIASSDDPTISLRLENEYHRNPRPMMS